jgi:hypothetical protein
MRSRSVGTRHFVAFAAVLAVALAIVTAGQQQRRGQGPRKAAYKVSSMGELRAKTPDDRKHAEFFDRYGTGMLVKPGHILVIQSIRTVTPPGVPPEKYDTFLKDFACSPGRAIVTGRATEERVLLTKSETELFTEYRVEVEQWIQPAPAGPSAINVLVIGGVVNVNGKETATERPYRKGENILEPDQLYFLVLDRIPGATGFELRNSFTFTEEVYDWETRLGRGALPLELEPGNVGQFISDLTAAAARCGDKRLLGMAPGRGTRSFVPGIHPATKRRFTPRPRPRFPPPRQCRARVRQPPHPVRPGRTGGSRQRQNVALLVGMSRSGDASPSRTAARPADGTEAGRSAGHAGIARNEQSA